MTEFTIGQTGLQLEAPSKDDVVTVRTKRQTDPGYYRHAHIWRVLAINGTHAVVERLNGSFAGVREVWTISDQDWFEASELWQAMAEHQSPGEAP